MGSPAGFPQLMGHGNSSTLIPEGDTEFSEKIPIKDDLGLRMRSDSTVTFMEPKTG